MVFFYTSKSKQNPPSLEVEITIALMNLALIVNNILSFWYIKLVYVLMYQVQARLYLALFHKQLIKPYDDH